MNHDIKIDDQHIVEEILRRRRLGMDGPAIPEERVRKFLARLGEELQRNGEVRQEVIAKLVQQTKDGTL